MIDAIMLGLAVVGFGLLLFAVLYARHVERRAKHEARIKRAEADLAVEDEIRKYLEGRRWR